VELFADRARHADMHFVLDGQSGPAVARLVRRLDGMPLAIELAAVRVEALGLTGLLDRLDDRFALLTSADRLAEAGNLTPKHTPYRAEEPAAGRRALYPGRTAPPLSLSPTSQMRYLPITACTRGHGYQDAVESQA
jgi:hypothetical protein